MDSSRPIAVTFSSLINEGVLEIGDGYRAKNDELGGEGVIFLRAGHVREDYIDFSGVERFHSGLDSRLLAKASRPGDTIVTTKGNSTGRTSFVQEWMPRFVYSPHLSYWRSINHEVLDSGFLRYWSRSREFAEQLDGMKISTDMAPYLSLSDQKRLGITILQIGDQRMIARILGTLDDKIELNRKTNTTLEAMARALFKSWFVDFDPVRAKAEGSPTGLPDEISDLFPDSFEDSELGEIPIGWEAGSIYDACSVVYGAPFSSALFNANGEGIPVARIRDLPTESPAVFTTEIHPKGTLIHPGDIVVGMDGEFRAYLWGGTDCWMNQRVCRFIPKFAAQTCFVMESIRRPLMDVEMSETATTVIHLGKGDIDGFKVVIPSRNILDLFGVRTQSFLDSIVSNKRESRSLIQLREALLPKLISGELRIPDAERLLEEAIV
jgi:type I restriction enzyme S subunit